MTMIFLFFIACICVASATAQVTVQLNNSQIASGSATSGELLHFYFSAAQDHGSDGLFATAKRAAPTTIYLTLTSCSQPIPPASYQGEVPSLDLALSISSDNTLPGPGHGLHTNDSRPGRLAWEAPAGTAELWVGVVAPTLSHEWTGSWRFEIGVSTQYSMHPLLNDPTKGPFMTLDDTDQNHALFLTSDPNPSSAMADVSVLLASQVPSELSCSLCAVTSLQVPGYSSNVSYTTRGLSTDARRQVLVSGLNQSQTYTSYLIQTRSGLPTGLGLPIPLQTKSAPNCRLVYGLSFCDQVAYSVPANPASPVDITSLAQSYDNQAQALYGPFGTAISQFNCDSTQYSLVRNCTDCVNDYKRWLCSVTIPRCATPDPQQQTPQGTPALHQVPLNGSRNPWIDSTLQPGEWTEMLPCIDLCYRTVQSCPPFMQFTCPQGDLAAVQYGYWQPRGSATLGYGVNKPTCNRGDLNTTLLVISDASKAIPSIFFLTALSALFVWSFICV